MILSAFALAEPYRATLSLAAGTAGETPAFTAAIDYGVHRHLALGAEGGLRLDGSHSLGAGLLVLPWDGRWARAGLALVPELADPFGEARFRGRAGLRAGWLALWGVGLTVRADLLLGPEDPLAWEWGAGLSLRM